MHKTALVLALLGLAAVPAQGSDLELRGCRGSTKYGYGMYYLPCSDIGLALVELRQRHPRAVITFASYSGAMSGGVTSGYYIIINPPPGTVD